MSLEVLAMLAKYVGELNNGPKGIESSPVKPLGKQMKSRNK
jgi:hypothetical protein